MSNIKFAAAPKCPVCDKSVYKVEEIVALSRTWHKLCFKCGALSPENNGCAKTLTLDGYMDHTGFPYCKTCYGKHYRPKGYGFGANLSTEEGEKVSSNDPVRRRSSAGSQSLAAMIASGNSATGGTKWETVETTSTPVAAAAPPPPPPKLNSTVAVSAPSGIVEPPVEKVSANVTSSSSQPAPQATSASFHVAGGSQGLASMIRSSNATNDAPVNATPPVTAKASSGAGTSSTPKCPICQKSVYKMEEMLALGRTWHKACFTCGASRHDGCNRTLARDGYLDHDNAPYCNACYGRLFRPKGVGYGNTLNTEEGDRAVDVRSASDSGDAKLQAVDTTSVLSPPPPPPSRSVVVNDEVHVSEIVPNVTSSSSQPAPQATSASFRVAGGSQGLASMIRSSNATNDAPVNATPPVTAKASSGAGPYSSSSTITTSQPTVTSSSTKSPPAPAATTTTSATSKAHVPSVPSATINFSNSSVTPRCPICQKSVYKMEEMLALGRTWHKACFTCGASRYDGCNRTLARDGYLDHDNAPYCNACYGRLFRPKGVGYGNTLNTEEGDRAVDVRSNSPPRVNYTTASSGDNVYRAPVSSIPNSAKNPEIVVKATAFKSNVAVTAKTASNIGEKFSGDGDEVREDEW